ncbi:DNA methyltransferase [Ruminococcaceae bacterium OttesenSCG-928-A11]|nr:DNA methyltransferase [Ruminococcaceae bacterium OttesenSCG-928-A11]
MKQYSVILCDPPWEYDRKVGQGIAQDYYPTMSLADICALPVADIAAKDSVLFMWVTFPMLREGLEVINAWGFQYKTCAFTWIKTNPKAGTPFWGMGFWTRSNAEICMLATKGKPKRNSNRVHQVIHSPIRRHSQKPDEARLRIEQLMGDVPRIELFAREAAPGWDVWGNEVECSIQLNEFKEGML